MVEVTYTRGAVVVDWKRRSTREELRAKLQMLKRDEILGGMDVAKIQINAGSIGMTVLVTMFVCNALFEMFRYKAIACQNPDNEYAWTICLTRDPAQYPLDTVIE